MATMNARTVRKTRWTEEETQQLHDAVLAHGARNWRYIATFVPTRTAKQCRERWNIFLDPEYSRGKWTPEEDRILRDRQAQLGNRWSDIAKYLPGRSCINIRNRWACLLRREKAGTVNQTTDTDQSLALELKFDDFVDRAFDSILSESQFLLF